MAVFVEETVEPIVSADAKTRERRWFGDRFGQLVVGRRGPGGWNTSPQ
jgi:hypothetical protein